MDPGIEVDIESGVATSQGSPSHSTPCLNERESTFFAKLCDKYVGGFINDEGWHLFNIDERQLSNNEANSFGTSSVNVETWKVKLLDGQESGNHAERMAVKEKRKKAGNIKPPKPPRSPRGPTLDVADQKLIREITELAMLKRARVERTKALKKMKASKSSSSSSGSIIAMIFTTMFFLVMLFQGLLSGTSSVSSFQGSLLSLGGNDGGLISVQLSSRSPARIHQTS